MKILLVSRMLPSLGGLETMARIIAKELSTRSDIQVKLVTDVAGDWESDIDVEIIRCPSMKRLCRLYDWCDVVFFNHCYIKLSLPLLVLKKPYVVSMSGSVAKPAESERLRSRLRRIYLQSFLRNASKNIAACEWVRKSNNVKADVIVNPYDDEIFRNPVGECERPKDIVFAGRIEKIKGCTDLVRALAIVKARRDLMPIVTMVGEGEGKADMVSLADELGVLDQLKFVGKYDQHKLAEEYRSHKIFVLPSRYHEPIGIASLEAIASGCIAVGSSGGGLGESVGECGFVFPNGDADSLAECLYSALSVGEAELSIFQDRAVQHLDKYRPKNVVDRYLEVVRSCNRAVD